MTAERLDLLPALPRCAAHTADFVCDKALLHFFLLGSGKGNADAY